MNPASSNLRGIVAMCISCLLFTLNDMLLKLASATLPAGQIIATRGLMVSIIILVILAANGQLGEIRHLRSPRVLIRAAGDLTAIMTYLPALFHMPIGNATTLLQMSPLVITVAAAIFLGERVGWRSWTAIAVGFLGVVVVARPGLDGFNAWSLLVVVSVCGTALRDLTTRTLPAGIPGLVLIFATGLGQMPVGSAIGLFEQWVMPQPIHLLEIAGASSLLIAAYYMLIMAMRSGDVAVVSTFRYSFVPYAIIAGFLVWGDVPDLFMLVGAAMILGAGFYVANRERLRVRHQRASDARAARPRP